MFLQTFASFLLLASAPLASAYIDSVGKFTDGKFAVTADSTFPVTFVTGTSKAFYVDLTATFALSSPDQKDAVIGVPLQHTVDLTTVPDIGNATFVLNVPLKPSDLFAGDGAYSLNVVVGYANGAADSLIYDTKILRVAFNAAASSSTSSGSSAASGGSASSSDSSSAAAGTAEAAHAATGSSARITALHLSSLIPLAVLAGLL